MKRCSKCKEIKKPEDFKLNKYTKSGLQSWCSDCERAHQREKWKTNQDYRDKKSAFRKTPEQVLKQKLSNAAPDRKAKRKEIKKARAAWEKRADRVFYKLRMSKHCPLWIKPKQLREWYRRADELGANWVVDHIIPLNGEFVTGLHVPQNLQLLSTEENVEKSNHFHPDIYNLMFS